MNLKKGNNMTEQEIERIFKLIRDIKVFKQVTNSLSKIELVQLLMKINKDYHIDDQTIGSDMTKNFFQQHINNNISHFSYTLFDTRIRNMVYHTKDFHQEPKQIIYKKSFRPIQLTDDHFLYIMGDVEHKTNKRYRNEIERNIFFDFKIIKNSTNPNSNEKLYTCALFFDVLKITEGKNIRNQYKLTDRWNIHNFDFSRSEILQEMQNILSSYGISQEYRVNLAEQMLQEKFPIKQTAITSSPDILKKLMIRFKGKNIVQQIVENLSKQRVAEYIKQLPQPEDYYLITNYAERAINYMNMIIKHRLVKVLRQKITDILTPEIRKTSKFYNPEEQVQLERFVNEKIICLNHCDQEGFIFFTDVGSEFPNKPTKLFRRKKEGHLMYFKAFLNEKKESCIKLIPCELQDKQILNLYQLRDICYKKQSDHPELYPILRTLLNNKTLFKQPYGNEIIITHPDAYKRYYSFIQNDKESVKLIVDKLRAIYTVRNVMDDIYRQGGVINTLKPRSRFIIENTDLVDDNNGSYIQSLEDNSKMIPMVDQMVQDYKRSGNLFERLWRSNLFREKQNVRNALCKEYELDEKNENNDIVIKFNEFDGKTYNEGFALVDGQLTYFEKFLENGLLSYRFIKCKPKRIIITERQLEEFIKDCDGYLRLKNFIKNHDELIKYFISYKDILSDEIYNQYLLAKPLSKNLLKGHIRNININYDAPTNGIYIPNAALSRKMTIQDESSEQLKSYVNTERALMEREMENDSEISLD